MIGKAKNVKIEVFTSVPKYYEWANKNPNYLVYDLKYDLLEHGEQVVVVYKDVVFNRHKLVRDDSKSVKKEI